MQRAAHRGLEALSSFGQYFIAKFFSKDSFLMELQKSENDFWDSLSTFNTLLLNVLVWEQECRDFQLITSTMAIC